MNQRPTIGRIVHYVLANDEHRPSIVVHVHSNNIMCNLQVFTDGPIDDSQGTFPNYGLLWKPFVKHDEDFKEQGTWHWPEREETDA